MASLHRIVLIDPLGDELFSGKSLLSSAPPPRKSLVLEPSDETIEECPPTLRSSVFIRAATPAEENDGADVTVDIDSGPRAA